jgi:tripeptide aminopeptidase
MKKEALERFMKYIAIDTQSSEESATYPSTKKQFVLAGLLVDELKKLGPEDVNLDPHCYVAATLKSNLTDKQLPVVAFIAHMDTAPNLSGANIKPQLIKNYQGGEIELSGNPGVTITEADNPNLKKCIGHTLVTTDGTTLLGADDKAGIAAIMTAISYFFQNPEIPHGNIKVAFTPDEEVGQGVKYFDIKKFGADFAYTLDGGMPGIINKETFSANSALVEVKGRDIHPGSAKNTMINSIKPIADIITELPKDMSPETTEGYEPFIHPHQLSGSVKNSNLNLILRDFNTKGLEKQKKILEKIIEKIQKKHPKSEITLTITESYRNMIDKLKTKPTVLDFLWKAAEISGAKPEWEPVRGGTDGSKLTEMGLPTPNIYTGGNNFHSATEWLSVDSMEIAVKTIINIVKCIAETK